MKKLIMPLLALIVCWGITGDLMAASKRDLQRKRHLDDKKNEVKWYNNLNTALTEAKKSNKQNQKAKRGEYIAAQMTDKF